MSFIDSYKRLEKLCSEMYGDTHGLSTYIDEMIGKPDGSYYVSGWNEDLKQLKHYRWVRNQIVHEPDCTEENMCEPGDMQWLDNFYSRIMSTNDPLALYRKVKSLYRVQKPIPKLIKKPQQTYSSNPTSYTNQQYRKTSSKLTGYLTYLMGALLVVVVFIAMGVFIANIYHPIY
ncbi:MAG: hypothetical protein K2J47_08015 [Ruminococcus sp.]|nr:hypothetical protein [Ruminococcus sp.]MDE6789247.1 hypothetical protein [Ruminococcus sp.]